MSVTLTFNAERNEYAFEVEEEPEDLNEWFSEHSDLVHYESGPCAWIVHPGVDIATLIDQLYSEDNDLCIKDETGHTHRELHVDRLVMTVNALRNYDQSVERLILPAGKTPQKFSFSFAIFGRFEPSCNTVACAWGMMSMLPEFQALGVRYEVHYSLNGIGTIDISYGEPLADGETSFGAAARFYGITYLEALQLFDPSEYAHTTLTTPAEIADNIERFIACREQGKPFVSDSDRIYTNYRW